MGSGLQFHLRLKNDVVVGPLQFELHNGDVGIASANLREYVMPACSHRIKPRNEDGTGSWESPVMIIPFDHVRGGACSAHHRLGEPVAHVALQFAADMDPESMLRSSNMADRILEVSDDCHTVCMDTKKIECP